MVEDVRRQANSFVGTLAQLQDSEKILASNEQAAREALEGLAKARLEEQEVRARIDRLQADSQAHWQQAADEIERMTALANEMRLRAQADFDARVSAGVAAGKAAHDAWADRTIAVESEFQTKQRQVTAIDEEVAKHQAVLDAVKREMSYLAARLTT